MLSSSLTQLLERARTRFGLEVEIFDAGLRHVYPATGSDLGRLIGESPAVRRTLSEALATGRPEQLERAGVSYRLVPLRRSVKRPEAGGLMATRRTGSDADATTTESWSELARAIVEADFLAADALSEEKLQSRRLLATLRFLRHLVEIESEEALAQAVVQAAAVWFDVDARIYQRDRTGDFSLHTALPGAQIEGPAQRLSAVWLSSATDVIRVGAIPEWGPAAGVADVALVACSPVGNPEWVLALVGAVPEHADSVLPVLARVVGLQGDALRLRRGEPTSEPLASPVNQPAVTALVPVAAARREELSPEFVGRLEQELDRARRFDLRLSLVLIGMPSPGKDEAVGMLRETLRRELRGSDVLDAIDARRVAALLTHTDAPGSSTVVGRMRRRLAEMAGRLNLTGLTIGHAAFSPDCRTAEALVSQAIKHAEPVAAR